MGIKFKNKTSAGKPSNGDIAERELLLNLKDKEIYSSTNGTDIVLLGAADEKGAILWDATKTYERGDWVTTIDSLGGGVEVFKEYFALSTTTGDDPTDPANAALWKEYNVVKWIDQDIEFMIGPYASDDFDRLDTALLYLGRYSMVDGATITLKVRDVHTIDYPINLVGLNLASIIITTEFAGDTMHFGVVGQNANCFDIIGTDMPLLQAQNIEFSTDPGYGFIKARRASTVRIAQDTNITDLAGASRFHLSISSGSFLEVQKINFHHGGSDYVVVVETGSSAFIGECTFNDYDNIAVSCVGGQVSMIGDNTSFTQVRSSTGTNKAIYCGGGVLSAMNYDFKTSGVTDVLNCTAEYGGIIQMTNCLGSVTPEKNTVTADGLIFKA